MFSKNEAKRIVNDRFSAFPYSDKRHSLVDVCLDLADEWVSSQTASSSQRSSRILRKDLKSYLMDRIDLKDPTRSYFVPSFIWTLLAKIVISWIINWIINNYIIND